MASSVPPAKLSLQFFFILSLFHLISSQKTPKFEYHDGPLLTGKLSVNLIWYGNFKPSQRPIISDFIDSFSPNSSAKIREPSVRKWWNLTEKYYNHIKSKSPSTSPPSLHLGIQILDSTLSLGKSLKPEQIVQLAAKGGEKDAINVVLTAADVTVDGFCTGGCGTHGCGSGKKHHSKSDSHPNSAFIWVGNSETQCPGQCAWPYHLPINGPQTQLIPPNNDVGLDGMVINLAGLLAGTVTNPFEDGFYQGPKEAPLEAASACPGVYGKGSYPGYAGELLVDNNNGASYNAYGVNGRKYLLPALFDPSTQFCTPLQ